jgi:hypothetical protein
MLYECLNINLDISVHLFLSRHAPTSSAEFRNEWSYPLLPLLFLHGVDKESAWVGPQGYSKTNWHWWRAVFVKISNNCKRLLLPALLCNLSSMASGTSPSKPLTFSFLPISALSIFRIFIQDWSLGKTKLRINANNVCVIPYFEIRYVVRLLRHFALHLVESGYPPHSVLGSHSLERQIPHNSRAARLTIPRSRK